MKLGWLVFSCKPLEYNTKKYKKYWTKLKKKYKKTVKKYFKNIKKKKIKMCAWNNWAILLFTRECVQ